MKFYNRRSELAELQRIQNLSFNDHSRLTVVTGRRRIGKTSLIMTSVEGLSTVYLFVGRKSEATLCSEFIPVIAQSLDTFVPAEIRTFRSLFQYLMELASNKPFNLRADNIIKLSAFDLSTLKEIMHGYYPKYTNDDLLALYTFTGGVPKYVELFCDNAALCIDGMIAFMVRENSPFTDEGKNLLIEEFGKNYATYFSILSAI
jgi:AAA+ ATPase superfamily predicted ATPase